MSSNIEILTRKIKSLAKGLKWSECDSLELHKGKVSFFNLENLESFPEGENVLCAVCTPKIKGYDSEEVVSEKLYVQINSLHIANEFGGYWCKEVTFEISQGDSIRSLEKIRLY